MLKLHKMGYTVTNITVKKISVTEDK